MARAVAVVVATCWVAIVVMALNRAAEARVRIQFVNSLTGEAIYPMLIEVRQGEGLEPLRVNPEEVARGGVLELRLAPGEALITVADPHYSSMAAGVVADEQSVRTLAFHMDPVLKPARFLAVESLKRAPKTMLLAGYVVDDASGEPLGGVRIGSGPAATMSAEDGWFQVERPIRSGEAAAAASFQRTGFTGLIREGIEIWPGGDAFYRIRLKRGTGIETVSDRKVRRGESGEMVSKADCDDCDVAPSDTTTAGSGPQPLAGGAIVFPKNIRVGRNCPTRTTCTTVEVYSMDTYVKRVLAHEWYACWGNVAGGMESLKAGSVSVRSYGLSFVYAPATASYDICDTTSCQVFGDTTSTNTNNATDQTTRYILSTASGVARSEYSAENNNSGCGDGFTGTGTSWPCIADPVCSGFAKFGHGRGLCQWGSARWATGKRLSSSQACTSAAPNTGQPTKNWTQILEHYYPNYDLVTGGTAVVNTLAISPNPSGASATPTFTFGVTTTEMMDDILVSAAIAASGSGSWVFDTPRDLLTSLGLGNVEASRGFLIPSGTPGGLKDVNGVLYYDLNKSGAVNSSDFIVADKLFANALTVKYLTTLDLPNAIGTIGSPATLTATLKRSDNQAPVIAAQVNFVIDAVAVGSALTDGTGTATLNWTVSLGTIGNRSYSANFAGNTNHSSSSDSAVFTRYTNADLTLEEVDGPRPGTAGFKVTLKRADTGTPMTNRQITFKVNGVTIGVVATNSSGEATKSFSPGPRQGKKVFQASAHYAGETFVNPASKTLDF